LQDTVVPTSASGLRLATHVDGTSAGRAGLNTGSAERPAVWLLGYIEEVGD